jgi:hypothetical protein
MRLVTNEDPLHVHKILGIFCLIHFGWRIFVLESEGSTRLLEDGWLTPFCLSIHTLLSMSSFIFRLSMVRHSTRNQIWPEFRLHSAIFSFRSLAILALWTVSESVVLRWIVVVATMLSADIASAFFRDQHYGSTMRQMPMPQFYSLEMAVIHNLLYSYLQLGRYLII